MERNRSEQNRAIIDRYASYSIREQGAIPAPCSRMPLACKALNLGTR